MKSSSPDGALGTPVAIATDGDYTLTSATTGKTVTVRVYTSLLPKAPSVTTTEDFEIYDVYDAERFSAADHLHRALRGGLAANRLNPHAQRVADLGDPIAELRQGVDLGRGLLGTAAHALVPRITGAQNTLDLYNHLAEFPLDSGGSARTLRLYSYSTGLLYATMNARWDGTNWNKDDGAGAAFRLGIGGSFSVSGRLAASAAAWNDSQWTSGPFSVAGLGGTNDQGSIGLASTAVLGANLLADTAGLLTARATAQITNSGRTLLFSSAVFGIAPTTEMRVYRASAPVTGAPYSLEFTFNCSWDGTQWVKSSAAARATKVVISLTEVSLYTRLAASSSPFTDAQAAGGWDGEVVFLGLSIGSVSASNIIGTTAVSTAGEFIWNPTKAMVKSIAATAGIIDNSSGVAVFRTPGRLERPSGTGTGNVIWPFELPDGAVIESIVFNGNIVSNGGTAAINVWAGGDNGVSAVSLRAASVSVVAVGDTLFTVTQNPTVDNAARSYYVLL